jgi:hypothetical protein
MTQTRYNPGDRVRIIKGGFAGTIATVQAHRPHDHVMYDLELLLPKLVVPDEKPVPFHTSEVVLVEPSNKPPDVSRYVVDRTGDKMWHRVDELQTKVYDVVTRCGYATKYPREGVMFVHPGEISLFKRHYERYFTNCTDERCK